MLSVHQLKPARGMLLVQPATRSEMSEGGILMPEAKKVRDKVKVESGLILRLGEPHRNKRGIEFPWLLVEGEVVFYSWTAGTEVNAREGKFLLVLHNELLAFESSIACI